MNLKEVKERIQAIELMKTDPESAHAAEDDLYEGFIKFLATNPSIARDLQAMAKLILTTKNIKFERHCS